ncbi:SpoIIE family protein phosphatase [Thalassospira sp. TSL5-1]|uniref:SpoIIE family protein phosphatase n=1 Tax=Thalassospira sp. TSL5-1 TaxID=1544451 RepID=UPI000AF8CF66|nr:SpoIIE family protein phosphatase [Thalassospira sp. TSL5-1]
MSAGSDQPTIAPMTHRVAIAGNASLETANRLIFKEDLFVAADVSDTRFFHGSGIEDFPRETRFQVCFLPNLVTPDWLGALPRLNCNYFIEAYEGLQLGDLSPLRRPFPGPQWDLLVCLSTQSAYHLPIARKFVTALRRRGVLHDKIAPTLEIAVQEAFSNSLLHGNMEIDTTGHLSMEKFNALEQTTRERLADPEFGHRAIILAARQLVETQGVEIFIHDQGRGFAPPQNSDLRAMPGSESTFGRGLSLIKTLCSNLNFDRDGRTIRMRFSSQPITEDGTGKADLANIAPSASRLFATAPQSRQRSRFPAGPSTPKNLPHPDGTAGHVPSQHSFTGEEQNPSELYQACILIADDTLISREIVASYLRAEGFTNLVFARDGNDALEQVRQNQPDLIILDIIMPGMDGYDVCKQIRADPDYFEVPIIAQTALEENEGRTRIFEDGATDLILKPLNKSELLARVRIHLEHRILVKQLRAYRDRTQSELVLAHDMQAMLVPRPDYYRIVGRDYGLSISATFQMSSELGGDIWGLAPLDSDRLAIYLVDFAGHGIGAALNTFRLHSLMWSEGEDLHDPGRYLESLNLQLKRLLPVGQYATMLYGIIDRKKAQFKYACAASTSPIIGKNNGRDIRFLDGSGVPLGITNDARYETRETPFGDDSFLMLYSDALIETPLTNGNMLDPERLHDVLYHIMHRPGGGSDLASQVTDYFYDHTPRDLSDDFTLITLQPQAQT